MLPKARWANTGRICRSYYKKMQFLILFNQKSPLKFIENASNNKKFTINRMHLSHYLVILAQANCREWSVNSQYSWEYCWPKILSPNCSAQACWWRQSQLYWVISFSASAVLPVIGQGGNGLWWISYCWEAFSINLRGDFWLNKMRNCIFL